NQPAAPKRARRARRRAAQGRGGFQVVVASSAGSSRMRRPLSGDGLMSTGFGDLKVFSGSAHPQLTKEIADFLGIQVGQARLRRFPDTEVSFQIDENIHGTDVFIVQPTS